PPRRGVLYHCGCGVAGCSGRACTISESGGVVRWSEFRGFVGLDYPRDETLSDEDVRPEDLPDLAFDAVEYRAEVERAKLDRSWETRRHRLDRLLTERLATERRRWNELGVEFRSTWLWGDDEEIYALDLRSQPRSPTSHRHPGRTGGGRRSHRERDGDRRARPGRVLVVRDLRPATSIPPDGSAVGRLSAGASPPARPRPAPIRRLGRLGRRPGGGHGELPGHGHRVPGGGPYEA